MRGYRVLDLAAAGVLTVVALTAARRVSAFRSLPLLISEGPEKEGSAPANDIASGAMADSPSEIPCPGWWAVIKRVARQFLEHRLMAEAAGVIFFVLLAIFPALAALVSLYGLFADPRTISDQLSSLAGVVPGGGMDIIKDQVSRVSANSNGKLGLGLVVGLLISFWSANQGMKALFDVLNIVYGEREKRSYIRLTLVTLGFTLASIGFILLAMGAVVVLPIALQFLGLAGQLDALVTLARWPLMLVVVSLFLSAIYRYGPSRERARWRWVSWGGGFAAIIWVLVSLAFSFYVSNFGSYNKTYGSLGAAIGFMTWIWISVIVVLLGAELNAELEHQTARDSTTGPERPLNYRGATKADTVAAD